MSAQNEALRLADALDAHQFDEPHAAAAELRRLSEIENLYLAAMRGRHAEPLYTAPRVPLAEWQINDLMADIDPEDRDSWSFRQGVYAAEKHHGVRK